MTSISATTKRRRDIIFHMRRRRLRLSQLITYRSIVGKHPQFVVFVHADDGLDIFLFQLSMGNFRGKYWYYVIASPNKYIHRTTYLAHVLQRHKHRAAYLFSHRSERQRAQNHIVIDAIPPATCSDPLHQHIVEQRRIERRPRQHYLDAGGETNWVERFLFENRIFVQRSHKDR